MMVRVSLLMSLKSHKFNATVPTQETTVTKVARMAKEEEEAVRAVDAEVAVEEATEKDAEEVMEKDAEEVTEKDAEEATVVPGEEMKPTEETLLMLTETQSLSTVLRPVASRRHTRVSPVTKKTELAAEEETIAEQVAAMDGVKIRRRSQRLLKAKKARLSQPVRTTETDRETTVIDRTNVVLREMPQ